MAERPGKPVAADERSVLSGLGTCISGRPLARLPHSTVTLLSSFRRRLWLRPALGGLNFAAQS